MWYTTLIDLWLHKRLWIAKIILRKKNRTGGVRLPEFILYYKALYAESCLTLCDPMNHSQPGSSVHGIFQGRILEWVAISFSRVSSQPKNWTWSTAFQADSLPPEPPQKATNIKVLHWNKNRNMYQWEKRESPEINPHTYGQLVCDKGGKTTQWRKDRLCNKCCWENWRASYKNIWRASINSIYKNRQIKWI